MENLHNVRMLINHKLKLLNLGKICDDVSCGCFFFSFFFLVKIDPKLWPYFIPDNTQPGVALTHVTTFLVISILSKGLGKNRCTCISMFLCTLRLYPTPGIRTNMDLHFLHMQNAPKDKHCLTEQFLSTLRDDLPYKFKLLWQNGVGEYEFKMSTIS